MFRAGLILTLIYILFASLQVVRAAPVSIVSTLNSEVEIPQPAWSDKLGSHPNNKIKYAAPAEYRLANLNARYYLQEDEVVTLYRRNIFSKIKHAFQKIGHGIKHAFQAVGHGIKKAAQAVGHGIKKAAQAVGHGIKKAAQTVGHGIKKAAEKVGHFVKTTGAKIAKFGLKVIATAQAVAAQVVRFIPVVGQAASGILKATSTGLNAASDAIHADLGKKLNKGLSVMNTIQHPLEAAAKAVAKKVVGKHH